MEKTEKVFQAALVAGYEAAEVLQPCEQPRDLPAPPVAAQRPAILGGLDSIHAVGRDQLNAILPQFFIQPVAVIGLATDKPLRGRGHEPFRQQGQHQRHFPGRSACRVRGDGKTMAVRHGHKLGPLAPLGFADSKPPFGAAPFQWTV